RLAPMGTARRERQGREERVAPRRDESNRCVREVLEALARRVPTGRLVLLTDEKKSYGKIASAVFGKRCGHATTPSTLVRSTHNPLFPINTTLAMTRDNCGRLRRRSWLVTKRAARLRDHMALFIAYRNYVRQRFNRDAKSQ